MRELQADRFHFNYHIPNDWPYMAGLLVVASCFAFFISLSTPPNWAILNILLAVGLFANAGFFKRMEREYEGRPYVGAFALIVAIIVPILLTGAGFTIWVVDGKLASPQAVAVLILMSITTGLMLRRRLHTLMLAQLACWSPLLVITQPMTAPFPILLGLVCAAWISRSQRKEEHEAAQALELSNRERHRAEDILTDYENTGQGWFWETDRTGAITYLSAPVPKALRIDHKDILGQHISCLFDLSDGAKEGERTLSFHLSARSSFNELPLKAATDEDVRWWSVSGKPVYDNYDNFLGFRGWGTDLTEKKRSQEQASRLAHFDSLTDLANRHQMSQTLERILKAQIEHQRECAIFLLDLDRFKQVNDTMGHPVGDALLIQVGQRLERSVGKNGMVGRLGGDEFQVIVHGKTDIQVLSDLAQDVIDQLSQPYLLDGNNVIIGASIGIALAPHNGTTSEELIRNADLALYAAKDGGRGRYHFYADDLHSEAEERRQLEHDLREAIINGGLHLAYQPVVDTATERIAGFEALLRWDHPKLGALPPGKFIPIAEDAGLIIPIGDWALRSACRDLAQWPEEVRVAVNVSPLQFANPQLPNVVTQALAQAGVSASRLELEITESVFLRDDDGTEAMFKALKNIGVRLALDDFGTGYSSLGYLKKAPFDKIKIDQSFVRGATEAGSRNGAIIASITSLAQALGMDTTAEGVETLDELDLVRMYGCSHVQGYIYEKPLSAEQALDRLQTGLIAVASGPRSARPPRQSMLRKVVLRHEDQSYDGTIRNVSVTGALIEGLWNVPKGTTFSLALSGESTIMAMCRWCEQGRMGVEFSRPLKRNDEGRFFEFKTETAEPEPAPMLQRRA